MIIQNGNKTIEIGENAPALVIPEIGINHNGSLQVAKEMVDAAYRAGARLIKHQTHVCSDEMAGAAKKVIPGNADISIYDIMEQAALSEEEELELKDYVESKGMLFLSTPFSRAAADRLEKFGVNAYKIGSGELNNYPLIEHIAEFGKPMIVSTGMNDLKSIEKTVNIMEKYGVQYALMHTTNLYPTKPEWVRLGAMQEMMHAFPGVPVGLSDHTLNNNACIAAIALGASLVERHFTDHMDRIGPDIVCSMDEHALGELLQAAREVPLMRGGHKGAIPEEQVTIDFAFATCVTIKPVKVGEVFTKENLWVKRPGTGEIPAEEYENILGKKATCDIENDIQLTRSMVEN
ncbi:N-acetylneuraminate synthase [Pseudobutyrivibrio sp. YE44]|uniref:N-acetylneuraminate synthase family protein n=1 Tax=Pseudobutyrivibrio sp. YE44 TaxID=1520802 RepID=UPI0008844436|nr:N-acetylneuraminate synthase family protein [Pseudobutyrivibrio sp. YE44]SDB39053.1 N-acetylneuraminate synthase [Pseudobutyrivibrio sp. YE44]